MTTEATGSTPGESRVRQILHGGHEFRFRLPSRADEAEIWRRFARKVAGAGLPLESDLLNSYDGGALLAEARLEVLLAPRHGLLDFGERAPAHWYRELKDADGKLIERLISFSDVPPEEFDVIAREVDAAIAAKKKPATRTSTDTAAAQISG